MSHSRHVENWVGASKIADHTIMLNGASTTGITHNTINAEYTCTVYRLMLLSSREVIVPLIYTARFQAILQFLSITGIYKHAQFT